MAVIRLFLLDDHELVRRGVRELLEAEPDLAIAGEAASVAQAHEILARTVPDVALLDARLPDGSGIDVCRQLRSAHPEAAALILTSYEDERALEAAVLAGAAGYLLKDIKGASLVDAVRTVASGGVLFQPGAVRRLRARWADEASDPRLRTLTPQELRILDHIARGMTNRQIAEELHLAEKTVKNYVTSVLMKLGMQRRTQAAVYAVTHRTERNRDH